MGPSGRLYAVTTRRIPGRLAMSAADVGDRAPSLTQNLPQAFWFEREIAEQWRVVSTGHPWFKPIRFHRSSTEGREAWGRRTRDETLPCAPAVVTDDFQVRGEEIHEVAVCFTVTENVFSLKSDLEAFAPDVGFLRTAWSCGWLRGDWLNARALICGYRFGGARVNPGGVQPEARGCLSHARHDDRRSDEARSRSVSCVSGVQETFPPDDARQSAEVWRENA